MRIFTTAAIVGPVFLSTALSTAAFAQQAPVAPEWSPAKAAAYMDDRAEWWAKWPKAARDHGTLCVSCHTGAPQALARPALRKSLSEVSVTSGEKAVLDSVTRRVRLWNDAAPFTPSKAAESRGTEAILNAFILVSNDVSSLVSTDARSSHLSADAKLALDNMWALQLKSGTWDWFEFHLAPWEANSQFYGATIAAIAVGSAPGNYQSAPSNRDRVTLLRSYLTSHKDKQTPADRVMLLWASTKLRGLLTPAQQKAIVDETLAKQGIDGGFSMASLQGPWKRNDNSPMDTASDGYATGLVAFAMEQMKAPQPQLKRALAWLSEHQNPSDGRWPALSMNETRTQSSDAGLFMSDAATAWAVLALTNAR